MQHHPTSMAFRSTKSLATACGQHFMLYLMVQARTAQYMLGSAREPRADIKYAPVCGNMRPDCGNMRPNAGSDFCSKFSVSAKPLEHRQKQPEALKHSCPMLYPVAVPAPQNRLPGMQSRDIPGSALGIPPGPCSGILAWGLWAGSVQVSGAAGFGVFTREEPKVFFGSS